MATTDIIFDAKTVDTKLAETYINTNPELHSIGFPENGSYECDKFKNTIYIANIDAEPIEINVSPSYSEKIDKLFALAKLIEKNTDLFCQLEYLIRGTPVVDVKKCDLKLIMDNLLYCYKSKRCEEIYNNTYCDRIAFLADTPLAALGFIAQSLCYGCVNKKNYITILSNKDTAIISFLFVDLCRQVGFEEVLLQLVSKDADCSKYNILDIEEISTGGVGIVTSKCDVDSAVDAFISSTVVHPWKLNKVFVQECVLERFKRALAWKSEEQALGNRGDDVEVSCAASYRCGDKLFALEVAGEIGAHVVALEAYRTVRELLALLGALRPLAASLWSSDVAESLEIAHGLSSTIVWVNDFADFRGPPRVSQAFYSIVDVHFSTRTIKSSKVDTLETLRTYWLRLSAEEREELITRTILQCAIDRPEHNESFAQLCVAYDFNDSLVRVIGNCVVTVSTITPARIWQLDYSNNELLMSMITFLINGGALLVEAPFAALWPTSKNKSIPIVIEEFPEKQNRLAKVLWKPSYEHKVIWTNYGTMFAN